ncbi:MAG: caspase family protein [Hyphomonadaceae bacterium]
MLTTVDGEHTNTILLSLNVKSVNLRPRIELNKEISVRSVLIFLITLLLSAQTAFAERVALVIGNADYDRASDLPQTRADAFAIADKLQSLGFTLVGDQAHIDLDRSEMLSVIRSYGRKVQEGDEAVFYFSGHGIGGAQTNYLLPTNDGEIETREDVADLAVDVSSILNRLPTAGGGVNIFVLDACRDNPLPSEAKSAFAAKGLARISTDLSNSVFLYAAAPGKQAYVSDNGKSYFTEALLEFIDYPDQTLTQLMRKLRRRVATATSDRAEPQNPWLEGISESPFYFVGSRVETAAAPTPSPIAPDSVASAETGAVIEYGDPPLPDDVSFTDPQATPSVRACKARDLSACASLGQALYFGRGAEHLPEVAVALFEYTCQAGSPAGCSFLGGAYRSGTGVEINFTEAKRLFEESCAQGFGSACAGLGELHQLGLGVRQDHKRAFSKYQEACRHGDLIGCYALGSAYLNAVGVEHNIQAAISQFQETCSRQLAQACNDLGFLHQNGIGLEVDYPRAAMLFGQACDLGWAMGCMNLYVMHANGFANTLNAEKRTELLERACVWGGADTCASWAINLYHGQGIPADKINGYAMISIACDDGSQHACKVLSELPS